MNKRPTLAEKMNRTPKDYIDHIPNLHNIKYLKLKTSMQTSKEKLVFSKKILNRKQACNEVNKAHTDRFAREHREVRNR